PDSLLFDRILDPAFARDSLIATNYRGQRLSIGLSGFTAFWQRHHLGRDVDLVGLETTISIPPMPLLKTPALQSTAGISHVHIERKTRGWVGVRWTP
ncbi:MAG: hypothetical protein QOD39_1761, partial [Mycobacterium sp.]|nr:hypothetical protein [Mycobacterium sp.]